MKFIITTSIALLLTLGMQLTAQQTVIIIRIDGTQRNDNYRANESQPNVYYQNTDDSYSNDHGGNFSWQDQNKSFSNRPYYRQERRERFDNTINTLNNVVTLVSNMVGVYQQVRPQRRYYANSNSIYYQPYNSY